MGRENSRIKRSMEEVRVKKEEDVEGAMGGGGEMEEESEEEVQGRMAEHFCTYLRKPNEPHSFFINLTEAERVLIQAQSFLELKHTLD